MAKSKQTKISVSDAKKAKQIQVYKNDALVGQLQRTDEGCELIFDKKFISRNPEIKISYHIMAQQKPLSYTGLNLPPYFAGLLPEGLRLKALTQKVKTSADDMFSLLVASGSDPVGDIHFSNISIASTPSVLLDFDRIKKDVSKAELIDAQALAGVQDKVSADRISLPVTLKNKNKSYILKLPSDQFPEIVQNEYITLHIAKSCGLNVNKTKVIKDENNLEALLVERFDREWNSSLKKYQRHHQEDGCQFLNKYPADKYLIPFQDVAQAIKEFAASPEIEILKLMQLKAFSYLIGNGDLHAKNISLLNDQLSPCYDIVCTAVYGDDKMALMLDGKNQNLKRKNFIDFSGRYGLKASLIENMLDKMLVKFEKNYENIFQLNSAKKKEKHLRLLFKERIKHLG